MTRLDLAVMDPPSYPVDMYANLDTTLGIPTPLSCYYFLHLLFSYYLYIPFPLLLLFCKLFFFYPYRRTAHHKGLGETVIRFIWLLLLILSSVLILLLFHGRYFHYLWLSPLALKLWTDYYHFNFVIPSFTLLTLISINP